MSIRFDPQLLTNMKQIIEVSQARGCWKAPEMRDIGNTYDTLCNILKELGTLQNTDNTSEQQTSETGENTGDSGNTGNAENVDGTGTKVLNI